MGSVTVGLVGTGPWASMVHAPMLAASPDTQLAGVWGRRPDAAAELAQRHGSVAFDRIEALFDACEAVAFAVPPGVQAELAVQAAQAGKALLLEKPIADSIEGAERLAAVVAEAGVVSMVLLTWRYSEAVRELLGAAPDIDPVAGRGAFLSGAFLDDSPFATPWRLERGALLDVGPHVIDLLEAALGPVRAVKAHGSRLGWIGLLLDHGGDRSSEASLCSTVPLNPHRAGVELYGRRGDLVFDGATAVGPATFGTVAAEFAAAVASGTPHPLDAAHGLHLQRILHAAETQLSRN